MQMLPYGARGVTKWTDKNDSITIIKTPKMVFIPPAEIQRLGNSMLSGIEAVCYTVMRHFMFAFHFICIPFVCFFFQYPGSVLTSWRPSLLHRGKKTIIRFAGKCCTFSRQTHLHCRRRTSNWKQTCSAMTREEHKHIGRKRKKNIF